MADKKSRTEEPDDDKQPEGMAWWREVARAWGPAIFAVLFIRTFIFEPFRIPSGSMIPTLLIGDFVVVNKSAYGVWVPHTGLEVPFMDYYAWIVGRTEVVDFGDPERGDIIVFRYPRDERITFIKRVVAIGGDTISVKRNHISLNGEAMPTEYISKFKAMNKHCDLTNQKLYQETLPGMTHSFLTDQVTGGLSEMGEITVPEGHVFVMGDNRDNSEDSRAWKFVRFDQIKGKAHFVWWSYNACGDGAGVRSDRLFKNLYDVD